jgi:hypothetical protein
MKRNSPAPNKSARKTDEPAGRVLIRVRRRSDGKLSSMGHATMCLCLQARRHCRNRRLALVNMQWRCGVNTSSSPAISIVPSGSLGFNVRGGLEHHVLPNIELTGGGHANVHDGDVVLTINGSSRFFMFLLLLLMPARPPYIPGGSVTDRPQSEIQALLRQAGPVFPMEVVRGLRGLGRMGTRQQKSNRT